MQYIRIPNCSHFPQNGEESVVNKWSDTVFVMLFPTLASSSVWKSPTASSPFALWWPSHLIRWLVWACYMDASSGNCTGFPPGFLVFFGTLTVICKAQLLWCSTKVLGCFFAGSTYSGILLVGWMDTLYYASHVSERQRWCHGQGTLWSSVEWEIAEHPPVWCGGREWGVWAVLWHQFPCCGGILRMPLAS